MLIPTNCILKIDEDYLDLVPRPTNEERQILKFSIMDDGQHVPIIASRKHIILDGHTRSEICEELHIKPKYVIKRFNSVEDERKFVILSNLARRNLTKFQKIELAWEIYENEKKRAYDRIHWKCNPDLANIDKKTGKILSIKHKIREGAAMEIFAKYMGTGHTVIHQIEWLKNNANKSMLKKLRNNEISITRAYYFVKGMKFTRARKKPFTSPKECPECGYKVRKAKLKLRKCHVHKWYCCKNCRWGI